MTITPDSAQLLTASSVAQFVENFTSHLGDDEMVSASQLRQSLTRELERALAPTLTARKELEAAGVPKSTIDSLYPSALQQMVHKVDTRLPGHGGYVTQRDEIVSILSEVSRSVSASVIEEETPESMGDCVAVVIKFGLTLDRGDL